MTTKPPKNDVQISFRAPREAAELCAHRARFYGRNLPAELRTCLTLTAAMHAVWMLRNVEEVRSDAGDQLDELLAEHEQHVERLQAEAFTRPPEGRLLGMLGGAMVGNAASN